MDDAYPRNSQRIYLDSTAVHSKNDPEGLVYEDISLLLSLDSTWRRFFAVEQSRYDSIAICPAQKSQTKRP